MGFMHDAAALPNGLAIIVGLFYAMGGLLLLRRLPGEAVMDQMLAALGEPTARTERQRTRFWMLGGTVTFGAGLSLVMLSRWAPLLFVLGALLQAGYLIWTARALPTTDAETTEGRRATVRAFAIYLAATIFVSWWGEQGLWHAWLEPAWLELPVLLAIMAAVAGLLLRGAIRAPPQLADVGSGRPAALRLVPEYAMSPLRDAAEDAALDPATLGLSPALVARIAAWDESFQAIFDDDNPFGAQFPDLAAEQAWFEEGLAVAGGIQREWTGTLRNDLSGLGTMIRYARRTLGPSDPTPLAEAAAMAPRCGVAEIRDAFQRLDQLAHEKAAIPDGARDAQDDVAQAQRFLAHLLAHVPERYRPELQRGMEAAAAETQRCVAAALAERDGGSARA